MGELRSLILTKRETHEIVDWLVDWLVGWVLGLFVEGHRVVSRAARRAPEATARTARIRGGQQAGE